MNKFWSINAFAMVLLGFWTLWFAHSGQFASCTIDAILCGINAGFVFREKE